MDKKYKVSVNYIENYQEQEIKAENKEQAIEKYLELLNDGYIPSVNGEYDEAKVSEVK